jgi:hypothetical protein
MMCVALITVYVCPFLPCMSIPAIVDAGDPMPCPTPLPLPMASVCDHAAFCPLPCMMGAKPRGHVGGQGVWHLLSVQSPPLHLGICPTIPRTFARACIALVWLLCCTLLNKAISTRKFPARAVDALNTCVALNTILSVTSSTAHCTYTRARTLSLRLLLLRALPELLPGG